MLEFLSPYDAEDAIVILKTDHEKVKGIFDDFEKAENIRQKKKLVAQAIMELKLHAAIEEEIFYPTVRKAIGKKIMNEADEEHHVVKLLIAELEVMEATDDHYDAKFKVLSENVRHHIKEEERDMLPHCRSLALDFTQLGKQMLARKGQLKKTGVAVFGEEKMVGKMGKGKGDSPAQAAKRGRPAKAPVTAKKGPAVKVRGAIKRTPLKGKAPARAIPGAKKPQPMAKKRNAVATPAKNVKLKQHVKKNAVKPALKKRASGRK